MAISIVREYPTLQDMTTEPSDVSYLLSLANDMRLFKGDEILTDLPLSEPRETHSCIIANAFNYGCEVTPNKANPEQGFISFQTINDRDAYLKVVGIDHDYVSGWVETQRQFFWWKDDNEDYVAPLTSELNQIALDFDDGKRFVEYVVADFDEKNDWLEELGIYIDDEEDYDEDEYDPY